MQSWGEVFEGDDIVLRHKEDLFVHDCCDESIPFFFWWQQCMVWVYQKCTWILKEEPMHCFSWAMTGCTVRQSCTAWWFCHFTNFFNRWNDFNVLHCIKCFVFFNWDLYSYWESIKELSPQRNTQIQEHSGTEPENKLCDDTIVKMLLTAMPPTPQLERPSKWSGFSEYTWNLYFH